MTGYSRSVVATGHELVSKAAADILLMGGNAFDAVVAAGFAGAVQLLIAKAQSDRVHPNVLVAYRV